VKQAALDQEAPWPRLFLWLILSPWGGSER